MSGQTIVLASTLLAVLLVSCDDPITALSRSRQARAGLDATMSRLPLVAGFDTIKVVSQDFTVEGENRTCYYARAYSILGASRPEKEAFEVYVGELARAGWQPVGNEYRRERVLVRGMNEDILVYYGDPGVDIDSAADYAKLRAQYRGLIFVSVTYMVPSRKGC